MIFRKDITRFWPLWAVQLVAGLLVMIAPLLSQLSYHNITQFDREGRLLDGAQIIQSSCLSPYTMVLSVLVAVSVFLYLTREREAYTIHAFPLKREQIFASHYLAGLVMIVVPVLLIHAGVAAVVLAYGLTELIPFLGIYLLEWMIQIFFFYSLACAVVMLTGNAFMSLVIYGVLNFLVAGVAMLYNMLAELFVYGSHGFSMYSVIDNRLIRICTPVVFFWEHTFAGRNYGVYSVEMEERSKNVIDCMEILPEIEKTAVYLIPAVVFVILAVVLYRVRQLESAGDMIAFSWGRPVFRIVFVFCSSLLFTAGVYAITFGNTVSSYEYGKIFRIVLLLVVAGTILFYLISNMILDKTFFIWKKTSYWRMALLVVLMTLGMTAVRNGQMGSGLPDRDRVQKVGVQVNYAEDSGYSKPMFYLTDSKDIRKLYQLNREILKYGRTMSGADDTEMDYIQIKYYLPGKNVRVFDYPVLPNADITKKVEKYIKSKPDICELLYGRGYDKKLQEGFYIRVMEEQAYANVDGTSVTDINEVEEQYLNEDSTEEQELRNELYQAMLRDIQEGKCDVFHGKTVTSFLVGISSEEHEEGQQEVQITEKCTNTMKVLEKMGLTKYHNGKWEMLQGK